MIKSEEIFIKIGALQYWTTLLARAVPLKSPISYSESDIEYMVEQTHRLQDEVHEAIRQLEVK